MSTTDDDAPLLDDARGILDRLFLLALEDASDRTYRLHAGRSAPFVTEVLCAELEVDGFLAPQAGPRLSDGIARAVAVSADAIAAGRRPVMAQRRFDQRRFDQRRLDQRSTER